MERNKTKNRNRILVWLLVIVMVSATFVSLFFETRTETATAEEPSVQTTTDTNISANDSVEKIETEEKIYSNATIDDNFKSDSVIVVLDKKISRFRGLAQSKISRLFNKLNVKEIKDLSKVENPSSSLIEYYKNNTFRQILHIKLLQESKQNVLNVIKILEKLEGIMYVGPDYAEQSASIPNDAYINNQWGLMDTYGINAEGAWEITTGSTNIRVGIIDSGIANHPDLNANLAEGWDFVNNNNITNDDESGHGTIVAGIIGAKGNNTIGVSGVAQNITLVPLQTAFWDEEGKQYSHYQSDVIEAINYASNLWGTNQQISVLNHSIAGFGEVTSKLSAIANFPGLFIWSAGNNTENVDDFERIEEFDLDNLISVGAIDSNGNRGLKSNYGNAVNIYAPGINILSTGSNGGYDLWSGTSMAAPYVSGVAALLWSMNPSLSATNVKTSILEGAVTRIISSDDQSTSKCLSASNALLYAKNNFSPAYLDFQLTGNNNGWQLKLINKNSFEICITYNTKMCFQGDAKTFTGLSDLEDLEIPGNSFATVTISGNGTAGWIVAAINYNLSSQNYRRITYTNGLSASGNTYSINAPQYNQLSITLSFPNEQSKPSALSIKIKERSGFLVYDWKIEIENKNNFAVEVTYNSKLCFEGDAKTFNVSDAVNPIILPANGKTEATIKANGTAGYIVACIQFSYHGFDYRQVTYMNNLNSIYNGTSPNAYTYTNLLRIL